MYGDARAYTKGCSLAGDLLDNSVVEELQLLIEPQRRSSISNGKRTSIGMRQPGHHQPPHVVRSVSVVILYIKGVAKGGDVAFPPRVVKPPSVRYVQVEPLLRELFLRMQRIYR